MVGFSRFIYCIFLRVSYSHSHSMFIVSYFRLSLHVFTGFIFVLVFFFGFCRWGFLCLFVASFYGCPSIFVVVSVSYFKLLLRCI